MKNLNSPPISQIIPELNRICEEHGLEKKTVAYRNTPAGEHGYLRAYAIYKERRGALCK